jgi:hypothetical protein
LTVAQIVDLSFLHEIEAKVQIVHIACPEFIEGFNRFAPFKPFMSPAVPFVQTVQWLAFEVIIPPAF